MKALSIKQPWAWLIVNGVKDVENRNWRSDYRGPLLIHASRTWDRKGYDFVCDRLGEYLASKEQFAFGALIGRVEMIDCVSSPDHLPAQSRRWFFGEYGFVFKQAEAFTDPIPYKGRLGLFD
ncbi:MAG: ASCH domain-containing protein, partial [Desulfatiglandales bacterium]